MAKVVQRICTAGSMLVATFAAATVAATPPDGANGLAGQHVEARQSNGEQLKRFSIDEYLKLEDLGKIILDPSARRLVFAHIPAVGQLVDYGSDMSLQTGTLMVADLTSRAKARALFDPEQGAAYVPESFSPGGERLAFYRIKKGSVSLGVYDFGTGSLQFLAQTPEISGTMNYSPVWVSGSEIVYPALPPGRQPAAIELRRYTGAQLSEAWNRTWEGREVSVSEVDSHADGGGTKPRAGELVRANLVSGEAKVMAAGLFVDLRVSADRRYLAASREYERPQPVPERLNVDWTLARLQLNVFDLKANTTRVVVPNANIGMGSLEWSPSAHNLAFFAWDVGTGVQSGRFHIYGAQTHQTQVWAHVGLDLASERERGLFERPERVVWVGSRLAIVARALRAGDQTPHFTYSGMPDSHLHKADWFLIGPRGKSRNLTSQFEAVSPVPVGVSSDAFCVVADGHVWRINAAEEKKDLTRNINAELEDAAEHSVSRAPYTESGVLTSTSQPGTIVLVDVGAEHAVPIVTSSDQPVQPLAASARAGVVVLRDDTERGTALLLWRAGGESAPLEQINSFLGDIAKSHWRTITYRVNAQRQLKSCFLLPPDYEPARRYPVVVNSYPWQVCPADIDSDRAFRLGIGTDFFSALPHLLAAEGYIVFYPSNPGDLDRTANGPIGGMTQLVLQGVDALAAEGYADPNRVGLFGFSQGGITSLWLGTQTDRFRAIVSVNGWADLASHYLSSTVDGLFYTDLGTFAGSSLRYETLGSSEFGLGQTPWSDPGAYVRNSPVFSADKIRNPIMLIHSDMDVFPLSQYDEMFTALYRLRKEAVFVRYWGEGHGPISPANVRDMWTRITAWYARWLDVPGPAN